VSAFHYIVSVFLVDGDGVGSTQRSMVQLVSGLVIFELVLANLPYIVEPRAS